MNNVNLIGRLTKDPELRRTGSGTAVVRFTVAVDRRTQANPEGVDFISCTAWEGRAETLAQYFHKGSQIGISGNIKTGHYDKDGQRIYTTDIIVERFDFLDPKEDGQQSRNTNGGWTAGGGSAASNGNTKNDYPDPYQQADGDSIDISDDDLPF